VGDLRRFGDLENWLCPAAPGAERREEETSGRGGVAGASSVRGGACMWVGKRFEIPFLSRRARRPPRSLVCFVSFIACAWERWLSGV
jgi:hypothetical protein